MSKPPSPFGEMPLNLPVVNITSHDVGPGFRWVAVGELVRTHYQVLLVHEIGGPKWRISSYFTHDGYHNRGAAHYRECCSIRTWASVLPQVIGKWWVYGMEQLRKRNLGR